MRRRLGCTTEFWLISRRQAPRRKREVIGYANFDPAFGSDLIRVAVRVQRNSGQMFGGGEFREVRRQSPRAFAEAGYRFLQVLHVFVDAQGSQVFDRILFDLLVLRSLVSSRPQHSGGIVFPGVLCHLGGKNLQERMSVGNLRSTLKGFRGSLVVPQIHVVNEAEVVIEPPVVRILLDAILHQLDGPLRFSGPVRRLRREKAGTEFVGNEKMRIQVSRDFQKRRQKIVACREVVVAVAEVLHGAGPVDAGGQAVIAETSPFDYSWRTQKQNIIERARRMKLVGAVQYERTRRHACDQQSTCNNGDCAAVSHLRSRYSKIKTAPLRAMVA